MTELLDTQGQGFECPQCRTPIAMPADERVQDGIICPGCGVMIKFKNDADQDLSGFDDIFWDKPA